MKSTLPWTIAAGLLLAALALSAPALASAERVVTRDGRTIEGKPRFEGDDLVIRRADGSEVRIPRSQVERIELGNGAPPPARPGQPQPPPSPRGTPPAPAAPPAPAPAPAQPSQPRQQQPSQPRQQPPSYPRYVPPQPAPAPDPSVGRRMGESRGFRSGLALELGYQRGLAVGAEWQQRMARFVGLGFGLQGGLAFNDDVACPTWGATGRLYVGNEHRFVAEGGIGLNRIDPYLRLDRLARETGITSRRPTCSGAEVNVGPEMNLGYQHVSRSGLLFEILGGLTILTNDELRAAHPDVAPLFQIGVGYVFR